jgi:hypothetical protein
MRSVTKDGFNDGYAGETEQEIAFFQSPLAGRRQTLAEVLIPAPAVCTIATTSMVQL